MTIITECIPQAPSPGARLTRREAAKFLGMAHQTLCNRLSRGEEPRAVKVGRRVFYRIEDLQAFIKPAKS